ncbi:hypothetical protein HY623_02505 [Candidatus Uhrbacteria bacterium]|nr:hypothetical protein [Candidatus Uhrbacteria bacterium]
MQEPKIPDLKIEAEREKLGREYYKFYFLFDEVLADIDKIMSGQDAEDFDDISDDEKERRAVLRHGIANWIMAPTMPVMSGRMEKFVGPEKNIQLDQYAEQLLRDVGNQKFTWKQRVEKSKNFILLCLDSLYPDHPLDRIREQFGGSEKEAAWIEKLKEEEREMKRQSTSQSPRT